MILLGRVWPIVASQSAAATVRTTRICPIAQEPFAEVLRANREAAAANATIQIRRASVLVKNNCVMDLRRMNAWTGAFWTMDQSLILKQTSANAQVATMELI